MASIGHYTTSFLFTLLIIISVLNLASTDTRNLSCPENPQSVCTALPFNISNPSDVWLHVQNLSVDEISLVVKDLKAHVSLSSNIAGLVSLNAGVDVSIDKVNLTILGIKAQVQLAVYLDNIAKIINRTMSTLDLNPLLAGAIEGVQNTVDKTVHNTLNKTLHDTLSNVL